jgi:putative flavoprotein involved in K+ transport
VLERGEVANTWRTERWDSLRLLTPNWLNGLPGLPYDGPDPDGYMGVDEVVGLVERFAAQIAAPVRTGSAVTSLRQDGDGYVLATPAGEVAARTVVIASGAFNTPTRPKFAGDLPPGILQLTPREYRGPGALPEGGVLVVGGAATGLQLAAEIRRSGRPVILSTGEHVRLPRTYRDRDILWWMDATGIWDERYDQVDDIDRARGLPSPQLVGTPERASLDFNALTALGVEIVGRFAALRDGRALFSGGLRNVCALADLKAERLLASFDEWAATAGRDGEFTAPERLAPTEIGPAARLALDLASGEIQTVIWATGFRPDYSWLDVPVVDAKGRLRHDGGVVDSPGLYALGLPVLRRRRSTFIHGIEGDAREIVGRLAAHLDGEPAAKRG